METRNILDRNENVIGTISMPDGTSEADWQRLLSAYDQNPVIPDVTPRQIRQALLIKGITMSMIDSALASFPEPTKSMAQIEWEYSVAFQRNRPLVSAVGQMLGWSSDQIDALWALAASL